MVLTDEEKREGMVELLEEKLGYDLDPKNLRPAEKLIVEKMLDVYENDAGVQSESIDDLSVSYFAEQDPVIKDMLHSLRKLNW
ncbi:hypothetical protein GM661_00515 [Iocasia frigidifontis]|uniref:Uncharacterized protein n=1 Tax=Iocasia fonsfrigidae TaxID=2682810 RepID=A0A8A7K4D1_9FIRM|nr:hypothetical protein [Iocasia fonsfrigidae]QTL96556.1 hypothetical protein GM661_00515 [Iocasia fonsfrigidae]